MGHFRQDAAYALSGVRPCRSARRCYRALRYGLLRAIRRRLRQDQLVKPVGGFSEVEEVQRVFDLIRLAVSSPRWWGDHVPAIAADIDAQPLDLPFGVRHGPVGAVLEQ